MVMILLDLWKHWLVLFAVAGRSMEETYRCLIEKLQSKADETSKPYWVAIGGGPGSGKTTLANEICSRLNEINPDSTIVIPMDGWHIPKEKLIEQFGTESMRRRGAPWTFDFNLMYKQLTAAKVKGEASLPIYSREISDPVPNKVNLQQFHRFGTPAPQSLDLHLFHFSYLHIDDKVEDSAKVAQAPSSEDPC